MSAAVVFCAAAGAALASRTPAADADPVTAGAAGAGSASGSNVTLTLTRQPPSVHMRPKKVAAASAPIATPPPAPPIAAPPQVPVTDVDEPASIRDLHQRVSAQVDLGYVVDGTSVTSGPPTAGFGSNGTVASDSRRDAAFATTRAYGFGEGFVSTHGVGYDSLSTYFAGQFQLVGASQTYAPLQAGADVHGNIALPTPIATWFDRSGFEPRAAYAEIKDFMPQPYLEPLRVRAGEIYIYGPWVMHFYGANAAWDGQIVHAQLYGGSVVPDYTIDPTVPVTRAGIVGGSVRVDLARVAHVPISFDIQSLSLTQGTNTDATSHLAFELAYKPSKSLAVVAQARLLSGRWVNEHVQARLRYHEVTSLVVDLTHSSADDWLWDPTVLEPDPVAARRYLDLGPVLPQVQGSARAGTLIAENVDVYLRGAFAQELDTSSLQTTYTPSYFEGGGALELRLRRTVALGASILGRATTRDDPKTGEIMDHPDVADPIPESASSQLGERGFIEVGTTARMTLGARKFSLLVEVYGRRERYALDYCALAAGATDCQSETDTGIRTVSFRGGGRVQFDAWVSKQLRLFASYEISSALDFEPEITGYKSLRLMMEGRY